MQDGVNQACVCLCCFECDWVLRQWHPVCWLPAWCVCVFNHPRVMRCVPIDAVRCTSCACADDSCAISRCGFDWQPLVVDSCAKFLNDWHTFGYCGSLFLIRSTDMLSSVHYVLQFLDLFINLLECHFHCPFCISPTVSLSGTRPCPLLVLYVPLGHR